MLWLPQRSGKDHNSKRCTKRRSCKICNGKQLTIVFGYVRKKENIDDNVKDETEK